MYRTYENPRTLEEQLRDAKRKLEQDRGNEDLAMEVEELTQRTNFAWQDEWEEE